jgi:5-methylthioadenosine/S-adenosylhomocysteine deaminase
MAILIKNATIVSMGSLGVINDGLIVIDGTRIVSIDPQNNNTSDVEKNVDEVIDATGKIVMPGLIDSHFHTCQHLMRGMGAAIARHGTRYPFWKNYLVPFESQLTPEDVYLSGVAAYTNLIRVGTTCFAEHGGRHPEQLVKAAEDVGIRGLMAISTMDMDTGLPTLPDNMLFSTEEAIEKNLEVVQRWPFINNDDDSLLRGVFSLRQITVCTPQLIQKTAHLAAEHKTMVQTHANEGYYELYHALDHHGMRPANYLASLDFLNSNVIAAHSVLLSDEEVELYAKHQVGVAHCPTPNFTSLGMTKLVQMRKLDIKVGIGTDGANRGSLDLFEAMKLSSIGQSLHYGAPYLDTNVVSSFELVTMATLGGARVCGLHEEIGSLEIGKRADLLILNPGLNALPIDDPYFAIVNSLRGSDVGDVIINGQIVMRNSKILNVDEEEIARQVSTRAPQLRQTVLDNIN